MILCDSVTTCDKSERGSTENAKNIIIKGIYASRFASGNAEWNKRWSDFKVTANIHDDFAMDLYNHLQVESFNNTIN